MIIKSDSIFILIHLCLHFCHILFLDLILHTHNKLVYISIIDLFITHLHWVLNHFIYSLHTLFLSHKLLHCFIDALILHFIAGTSHNLGHAFHYILHWLIDSHLLKPTIRNIKYSNVTFWSWLSSLSYFATIWLFFRICWATCFWACLDYFLSIIRFRFLFNVFPWYYNLYF